jgi:hypothetical protein
VSGWRRARQRQTETIRAAGSAVRPSADASISVASPKLISSELGRADLDDSQRSQLTSMLNYRVNN